MASGSNAVEIGHKPPQLDYMQSPSSSTYWDEIVTEFQHQVPLETWRAYMQAVYVRLIRRWLAQPPPGFCLKTDLFEEAVSAHSPWSALGPNAIGIDISPVMARSARLNLQGRGEAARVVVSDLRSLPFRSGSFQSILSGSSLDHFSDATEIERSLGELGRILKPGGMLVITFDNPHNPVVWIRNHLPFRLLNRIGLVPYYVGATYTVGEARAALERLGLSVTATTAVAHAPRAPVIWLLAVVDRLRWPAPANFILQLLYLFESLERLPSRYITGYYIGLWAQLPE